MLNGVTTNPTLVAKEGVDFKTRVIEICKVVDGPVSAEVTTEDPKEMISQGRDIAKWAPNVMVKCPLTPAGLEACKALSKDGIKVNVTLCFSVNQRFWPPTPVPLSSARSSGARRHQSGRHGPH